MDGATHGQVVLSYIIKQAEQAIGNKSIRSVPLWPLFQVLPLGSLSSYSVTP